MSLLPDRISTGSLELIRWSAQCAPRLHIAYESSFTELHHWMPWATQMPTVEELAEVLDQGDQEFAANVDWSYTVQEPDGQVIGSTGVHQSEWPHCREIGYWIRTDRTGRGYATAAASALTTAIFDHLPDVSEVRIRMDPANFASAAVPAKLNYQFTQERPWKPEAPGETGGELVWVMPREAWADRSTT